MHEAVEASNLGWQAVPRGASMGASGTARRAGRFSSLSAGEGMSKPRSTFLNVPQRYLGRGPAPRPGAPRNPEGNPPGNPQGNPYPQPSIGQIAPILDAPLR